MRIWGYWATLGWAVLAFLAGQFIGFGLLLWLRAGSWNLILETPYDGVLVTLFILISNPVTIGVLALAVRLGARRSGRILRAEVAADTRCDGRHRLAGRV